MPNLCDGVMNGMVEELLELYEQMTPFMTKIPTKMVGSGNGICMNHYLAERFAKRFGMSMTIPSHKEEAAYGAALFGLRCDIEILSK